VIFGPLKLALRIASLVVSVVVFYFAVTFVQIWMTGHDHSSKSAQAILVFGTTEDNGRPSPELKARLDHALMLWHDHRARWVVVTGGKLKGDVFTEAGVSATYVERHGVPANRVVQGSGHDTWQNVATVVGQLRKLHIVSVLTVTDPFHEDRAMAIASAQGLTTYPSPVGNSPTVTHSLWKYYAKETFEVGVGRIIGYGRLSTWTSATPRVR
jgi:uncharacterized SAM-binding protein YcdF (DUF218 family)